MKAMKTVSKVMSAVQSRKVVAIVRGFDAEVCLKLAEAYVSSGIGLMEVTFDQSRPDGLERSAKAIEALSRRFADEQASSRFSRRHFSAPPLSRPSRLPCPTFP